MRWEQEQATSELVMQQLVQAQTLHAAKLEELERVESSVTKLAAEAEMALEACPKQRLALQEIAVANHQT